MTPTQPPAAGLDLDALEAAVAALTTSAYTPAAMRRAAVDTMVQAASTLIAEVRYFRAWQDEEDADAARINAALHEQSDTIETLRADLAARDATIAELRAALFKAIAIAESLIDGLYTRPQAMKPPLARLRDEHLAEAATRTDED